MSRLLLVNPNADRTVTGWLADEARRVAPAGVEIVAVNADSGLAALQTPEDIEIAGRAVVDAIAAHGVLRGAVVAAFGDPGLATARAWFPLPVVGLGECGLQAAGDGGRRFSLVTLGVAMREVIAAKAAALGLGASLVEIVVLPFSISQMVAEREALRAQVYDAVRRCRCEVVLLGGAPFAGMARGAGAQTGKVVLDGLEACLRQF
jgi:Asp/Glu/hydantoin racemase